MKNLKTIALALVVALGTLTVSAQTGKKADPSKSSINWVGKKFTGQHTGTIDLKEGTLIFKGEKLVGGNFTVDMATISTTDLSGKAKTNLDGHLKADDFFGTEKFPTSKLVFKSIGEKSKNVYTVTADLTIKEITNPIQFEIIVDGDKATTALKVDRTKYDIKYASTGMGVVADKAISDEFELNITLQL